MPREGRSATRSWCPERGERVAQTSASGNSGNSGNPGGGLERSSRALAREGAQASPLRAIPADHKAERAVLGALLLDHDALYKVADKLRPESFDLPRHRIVYGAFLELSHKHQGITLLTLRSYLEEVGELEAIGGLAALTGGFLVSGFALDREKDRDTARMLLEASVIGLGYGVGFKYTIGRLRPRTNRGARAFEPFVDTISGSRWPGNHGAPPPPS